MQHSGNRPPSSIVSQLNKMGMQPLPQGHTSSTLCAVLSSLVPTRDVIARHQRYAVTLNALPLLDGCGDKCPPASRRHLWIASGLLPVSWEAGGGFWRAGGKSSATDSHGHHTFLWRLGRATKHVGTCQASVPQISQLPPNTPAGQQQDSEKPASVTLDI